MSEDVLSWLNEPGMQVLNISTEMVKKWGEEISHRYSENRRHYHTLKHLSDMMKLLHTWGESIRDYPAVVLAVLFHDIVYNPESPTNENDSVELFKTFAEEINLSEELSQKVAAMIKATIKHLPEDEACADPDLLFFLDFDMAILGQSQQVYDLYAANIRQEYCHMDTEAFCKGRTKVLQTFVARPRIYFTEELHKAFDNKARQNMLREVESLDQQLFNNS
ncbi:uncharacterized protein LOC143295085 [Babylonia areolata]|uniref:uncharacterized protein LOC143295085 n=1 Tax=Babylonia areolata TaxID=304850 RepID=UPI003FD3FC1F